VQIAAGQLTNELGIALYMVNRNVDAAESLAHAAAFAAANYGDESPQVGVQHANLAMLQWSIGQPQQALQSIERAVVIHRLHLAPDDARLAIILNTQARILDDLNLSDEALRLATEALGIAERAYGTESAELTDLLETITDIHMMRGEFDAAEPFLTRAVTLARAAGDPRDRFNVTRTRGLMEMYRDSPQAAIPWLEEAREAAIARTSGQGAMPLTIRGMLAWARGLAGEIDPALAELEQVRLALAALPQPNPTDELVRRYYTGEVALRSGRLPLAIENLREALRLADANPPMETSTFADQSRLALGLALWPDPAARDEARMLLDQGIAGMERRSMGFHPLVGRGREVLAAAP
jgi:tetratricopeptide (TPR) repeat protein